MSQPAPKPAPQAPLKPTTRSQVDALLYNAEMEEWVTPEGKEYLQYRINHLIQQAVLDCDVVCAVDMLVGTEAKRNVWHEVTQVVSGHITHLEDEGRQDKEYLSMTAVQAFKMVHDFLTHKCNTLK